MSRIFVSFIMLLVLIGCKKGNNDDIYSDLERFRPVEIVRFDQVGDHYFSFIGTGSVALESGSFLIADRSNPKLILVSSSGGYMGTKAREGRGPGEVQDVIFLSKTPSNGVLAYDQRNRKIIELDEEANFKTEFVVPPLEGGILTEAYLLSEKKYLLVYRNIGQVLNDSEATPQVILSVFEAESSSIIKSVVIEDALMATHIVDGVVRGGRRVDFGALPLRTYDEKKGILYSFWSGGDEIALLDQSLDTLSTVPLNLEKQSLSSMERDSLRNTMPAQRWAELEPLLPKQKAIAREMHVGAGEKLWLLLNHRSEFNEWLVIDLSGTSRYIVELPKGSFLTHISESHLGVRLDDATFALYESISAD